MIMRHQHRKLNTKAVENLRFLSLSWAGKRTSTVFVGDCREGRKKILRNCKYVMRARENQKIYFLVQLPPLPFSISNYLRSSSRNWTVWKLDVIETAAWWACSTRSACKYTRLAHLKDFTLLKSIPRSFSEEIEYRWELFFSIFQLSLTSTLRSE